MKIKVKKEHVMILMSFVSMLLGYLILQNIIQSIHREGISILVVPTIFIFSTLYVMNYWRTYIIKAKIAEEVAKEIAEGNHEKEQQMKDHLKKKIDNDVYIISLNKKK